MCLQRECSWTNILFRVGIAFHQPFKPNSVDIWNTLDPSCRKQWTKWRNKKKDETAGYEAVYIEL